MARDRKASLARRDFKAIYQKRKANAQRLGYSGLDDQRKRRKAGELTHADQADHAKREGGTYVDNLGRGRWTFKTPQRGQEGLSLVDRARLQQTLDRGWRADANTTITATWVLGRRTGTAQAGGSYGVRVRRFHNLGADAHDGIENELQNSTGSELPAGATITSLALFLFPAKREKAA